MPSKIRDELKHHRREGGAETMRRAQVCRKDMIFEQSLMARGVETKGGQGV